MAHKSSVDAVLAIEGFLKRKDDEHAIHIALYAANAVLLPRPELRTDEIDDWNPEPVESTRKREVYIRKVNEDGRIWSLFSDAGFEPAVLTIDVRDVPDDLGNAHDGYIFSSDDAPEAQRFHALPPEAEEAGVWNEPSDSRDKLRGVVLSTGLAGGEEDFWSGHACLVGPHGKTGIQR